MMRSLFAAVSGLRNHQIRMDVIGNNIANVNTVGYKSSRVTFEEGFAQVLQGASRPPGDDSSVSGGVNPIQVGLGMNVSSIDLLFSQGSLEATGNTTDLAIQGDSFFVVSNGQQRFFTRSGNFQLDANGRLVSSTNGFVVQGRLAQNGVLSDRIGDIKLPFGQKSAARATTSASIGGNLNAEAPIYDPANPSSASRRESTIVIFNEQGIRHELRATFTKTAANEWTADIEVFDENGVSIATDTQVITFDDDGSLLAPGSLDLTIPGFTDDVTINFGTPGEIDGLSQFASPSSVVLREQDGYTMGYLQNISIDPTGTITGSFTNGVTLTLGQIVLADFNNPSGLMRVGDNMYALSANSGEAVLAFAGAGSQSQITAGALEMSNVDLAQEFTNMITAQRGFQSNARVITTSDEMLQELVNLKR
jgi:flagellar hook protein FlgE